MMMMMMMIMFWILTLFLSRLEVPERASESLYPSCIDEHGIAFASSIGSRDCIQGGWGRLRLEG